MKPSPVRSTINHLTLCRAARAQGYTVSFTTDPKWLVNMAINRRAGWPDDPSHSRGSAMPISGKYPKKAHGSAFIALWRISREVNTARLVVRASHLGEWRKLILERMPQRISEDFFD